MYVSVSNLHFPQMKLESFSWGSMPPDPPQLWLSIITGLDYWNGLLEWTTGLTHFALKINFILSNKSQLPAELWNGTYLAAQTHLQQANSKRMM